MRGVLGTAIAVSIVLASSGSALAQQTEAAFNATTLNLSAQGETRTKPDIVTISIGVVTEAPTASAATSQTSDKIAAIVRSLRSAGVAPSDIQTQAVELEPRYSDRSNSPREIVAQRARISLSTTIRQIDKAGAMLDLAVAAGANEVNGIRLGMANPARAQLEARDSALRSLQENAAHVADVMGYRVARMISVSTSAYSDVVVTARRIDEIVVTASRVQPGELTTRGQASGVFELTPK